jgi:hypothetical protein
MRIRLPRLHVLLARVVGGEVIMVVARRRGRVDWRVRSIIATTSLVAGLTVLGWQWWSDRDSVRAHVHRIEQAHGIKIGYGSPADFWTPPFKPEDATSPWISMQQAKLPNVAVALDGVDVALDRYPPGFVARLIRAIFICDELRMGGESASGTVGPAWIILSAPSRYGVEGIRFASVVIVHHELSSLVLRVDPTTWHLWAELAPAGWQFVEDPGGALRRGHGPAPPLEMGFLSAYGATNLENDFNVYAETIFTEPASLALLARQHPMIRRKLDLVLAAYVAIDPRFADRFRLMGLNQYEETAAESHN